MSTMACQIISVSSVCSTVSSDADQRKQKFCVTGLCEGNPPVTGAFPSQKTSDAENFPFDDVIIKHKLKALIHCLEENRKNNS